MHFHLLAWIWCTYIDIDRYRFLKPVGIFKVIQQHVSINLNANLNMWLSLINFIIGCCCNDGCRWIYRNTSRQVRSIIRELHHLGQCHCESSVLGHWQQNVLRERTCQWDYFQKSLLIHNQVLFKSVNSKKGIYAVPIDKKKRKECFRKIIRMAKNMMKDFNILQFITDGCIVR